MLSALNSGTQIYCLTSLHFEDRVYQRSVSDMDLGNSIAMYSYLPNVSGSGHKFVSAILILVHVVKILSNFRVKRLYVASMGLNNFQIPF